MFLLPPAFLPPKHTSPEGSEMWVISSYLSLRRLAPIPDISFLPFFNPSVFYTEHLQGINPFAENCRRWLATKLWALPGREGDLQQSVMKIINHLIVWSEKGKSRSCRKLWWGVGNQIGHLGTFEGAERSASCHQAFSLYQLCLYMVCVVVVGVGIVSSQMQATRLHCDIQRRTVHSFQCK